MRRALSAVGLAALLAAAASVGAQPLPSSPPAATSPRAHDYDRVDPRLFAMREVIQHEGPRSPYFGPGTAIRADGAMALLRFDQPPAENEVAALEALGVRFKANGGREARIPTIFGAFVPWGALEALETHPRIRSVDAAWHPVVPRPLEVTVGGVFAEGASTARPLEQGEGVVIGAVDSGVDVFHPHLFHADAGAYRWLDVNENGQFEPEVDAVDLNGNGEAGGNETLLLLDAVTVTVSGDTENEDGTFDLARDWVFADANRDRERNFGREAGFTEFDPAYGEPIFVADDVNGDGELGLDEKLLRLGRSKVLRYVTNDKTWVRGEDLIDAQFPDVAVHGTGVAGILVGGQAPHHDRVGAAPGADLIMYASYIGAPGDPFDETAQLADLQDAVDSGVDVIVHEWTNPFTAPHDGSSVYEAAMDTAFDAGVVQVNPAGNLNRSEKHREVDVAGGETVDFVFEVDEGFQTPGRLLPYSSVYGSVFWRGDQMPSFSLVHPDGTEIPFPMDETVIDIVGNRFQATHRLTERGTHHVSLTLWNVDPDVSVAFGEWIVRITDTTVDDRFVGRITDFWSSWGVGVRWVDPTSDYGTIAHPATADSAIGVAAYSARGAASSDGTDASELSDFSGRGPRLDGAPVIDITAPDDAISTLAATPGLLDAGFGTSWFRRFGGTSGAAPHVAGAIALLRAARPDASVQELVDELHDSGRPEPSAGEFPNSSWGYGKLDVFGAVTGEIARAENASPVVDASATVLGDVDPSIEWNAANTTDPDGDELNFRWDFDYDGTWDTDWTTDPVAVDVTPLVRGLARLEVRDPYGARAGLVLPYELEDEAEPDPALDMGLPDVGEEPTFDPGPCECASVSEGGGGTLLLFGVLFLGIRVPTRRRRGH